MTRIGGELELKCGCHWYFTSTTGLRGKPAKLCEKHMLELVWSVANPPTEQPETP